MKISPVSFNIKNCNKTNSTPVIKCFTNTDVPSFIGASNLSNINRAMLCNNISFGNNIEIINMMKKENDFEKLLELFHKLTKKAQDNVLNMINHPELTKDGKPLLTLESYLPACVKEDMLFRRSPDTLVKNIVDLVNHPALTKDGEPLFTIEKYLQACLRQPTLPLRSADTLIGCMSGVVNHKNLRDADNLPILSLQTYALKCLNCPPLFYQQPESVVSKITGVINSDDLKDEYGRALLSLKKYLAVCTSHPPLFCQLPSTVVPHIKALMFVNKDRMYFKEQPKVINADDIVEKALKSPLLISCTNKLNYSYLLREKMFPDGYVYGVNGNTKVLQKLKAYLSKHPDKRFDFKIIKDEMSDDFIEFANKFGKEATGHDNVFNITCVNI